MENFFLFADPDLSRFVTYYRNNYGEWVGKFLFAFLIDTHPAKPGQKKAWQQPTFPPLGGAVSSAWEGLTSVFGKGTGMAPPP